MSEQRVWHNISKPKATGVGYFVTEVMEVIGEPWSIEYFEETLGSGYILVSSYHFFNEAQLKDWLGDTRMLEALSPVIYTIQPRG